MADNPILGRPLLSRVGMVGGGPVARMTYQAGIGLGLSMRVLAERPEDPAALAAAGVELGEPAGLAALARFADGCDVVTFAHEMVAADRLEQLVARGHELRPGPGALLFAQDLRYQREQFRVLRLPVPPHAPVAAIADVEVFAHNHGWPVVLKAARGRGIWIARNASNAAAAYAQAGPSMELLAEAFVPIEREVAVLVARRPGGESVVYPVVETVRVDGMCREVVAPADIGPRLTSQARELALRIAGIVDAVGIMALELFLADGVLLINRVKVRPHNSGHFSIEGCGTSQFENHLRAVLDWPLGDSRLTAPAVVALAVVGDESLTDPRLNIREALAVPGVHVHLYGSEPAAGRWLGHVTALGDDAAEVRARVHRAAAMLLGANR
ncbi:MAG: 5-(carboxyamino)imidazole ribonucleotide synthase [Chloroflexi bacterium]|nr:5-(carboxyamino)imidazole ribonucleotide synthase [Chloroflexota bacterium]